MESQLAQISGPLKCRQIEVASVEAVRKKWMAAPPHHTLVSDPELFPLEECAMGRR